MPGLVQNRRKRPSPSLSDDEEEQSERASSVSATSKRARHARDASDSPVPTSSRPLRNESRTQSTYGEDEFPPGSLVRVKLRNFVTYTAAEFHLGPSLNMVIGPNGTGKSTLVCAICLGLGWSSEHLGRAKEIGLFVKNGSTEAEIEIELARGPGMSRNPVVRRIIRKDDNNNSKSFWIDGKLAGKNAVLALCKKFSIQIDNLCQFLPQDRVVEFAKMSDVDRLRETQRAAAPPHMVEWHDQLKALRAEERGLETRQQNERSHLEKLEKQQNATRDDVDRWHQREGLLKKSKCLKKVKPIIELGLLKKNAIQAKEDLRDARRELDGMNAEVEPMHQAQAEVEAYHNQIDQVVRLRKNRVDTIKTKADKLFTKIENEKQAVSGFAAEVSGEAHSKKERERDIARTKADIAKLERQRQDQPVEYDAEPYDQQKADLRAQQTAANNRLLECESALVGVRSRAHELNLENRTARAQRDQLDTQSGKQASVLAKLSRDTSIAWDWVQKNRAELPLKGEVLGPSILECSIQDPRYAEAIETQLRKGDLLAITCTHADDQKLLSNKFLGRGQNGLGLNDIYLRTSPKPLSDYRPPVAPSELARFGFEGYIIDYIQGPDAVLAMLCDNARLNRVAYSSRPISEQQHEAVTNSAIQTWVSGREIYKITTRKEYGASSTSVTPLRPARVFVDQPTNSEEKRQLDDTIKRVQQDSAELKEQLDSGRQELASLKEQIQDFRQKRDDLQAEQDRMRKAVAEWQAIPGKISQKQEELDRIMQKNAETNDRIRVIKAKSRQASLDVALTTLEYAKAVTQLRTLYESLVEAEIRFIEAKSELSAIRNDNRDILQKLQAKQAEIQTLDQRHESLRKEYKRLSRTAQEDLYALEPDEKAIVMEYRELPSLEALDQEVQAVAARLEMMAEGNPGAIKSYERREDEIAKTREKLEEHTASLENTKEQIIEIRQQWEPELDALISRISDAFAHNFQEIGCAGEVIVYKDEDDFDKWSAQISVRFREGETLSVLDSHRQSGGERAVSTIFYLMALQDLAQSPFRVVDEINQGMDPRNERMVHERMVDIACQERTSQYFLITPKLLTGLKFHPKMKVHVINSGEHVPEAKDVKGGWNMREWAKVALRERKGIEVA